MPYEKKQLCWKCGAVLALACSGALFHDRSECPNGSWCRVALPPPVDNEQRIPAAPSPMHRALIVAASTSTVTFSSVIR
jgi:hypothetical protein